MTTYRLSPDVYFGRRGEAFVFLDLRQDEYTLISGRSAKTLEKLSDGEEALDGDPDSVCELQELLSSGLITTDTGLGKALEPTRVQLATESLTDSELAIDVRVTVGHICHFFSACLMATIKLRWWHLANIVNSIRQRKARACALPIDVLQTQELANAFLKLRALFPRNYLCLYDSLALIEFLARYRIYPTWVFGFSLEPWAAHCWVQADQYALNEGVEEAAGYTPVMTV